MKNILRGFEVSNKKYMVLAVNLLFMTVFVATSFAANFVIEPTTMYLSAKEKSGAFSVVNNSSEKIDFQVSVQEWGQDEKGKDVFTDTKEIVFFPKVMSVDGNSQRAVRIGLKTPPSAREKTYRLFVQEIPTPKKTEGAEAQKNIKAGVTIAFRFSIPIFITPIKSQESYAVDRVEMSKGTVKTVVKNTGNVHIKLRNIIFSGKAADGKELFTKEVAGWYILNGLSTAYEAEIPKDVCARLAAIDVKVQSENGKLDGKLNVEKSMCAK